jgi:hypothetical protein
MVLMIYGLLLSNKTRFLNSCVKAVDNFTSSLIDFWCFKYFKLYYKYRESEKQQGTCDKGRIIGMDESKEKVPNNLACTNIGNLPTGKTKEKESPQKYGPFSTRIFQQRNLVSLFTRLLDGPPGILGSIPGKGKRPLSSSDGTDRMPQPRLQYVSR